MKPQVQVSHCTLWSLLHSGFFASFFVPNCPEVRGLYGPYPGISPHCLSAAAFAVADCSPQAFSLRLHWHQIPWLIFFTPKPLGFLHILPWATYSLSFYALSPPNCSLGPQTGSVPFLHSPCSSLRLECFSSVCTGTLSS